MLVLLVLICVLCGATYLFFNGRYAYWKERGVPFPKPTFLVGNIGNVLISRISFSRMLCSLYEDYQGYPYVGFFNLWRPALVIRDPELIKDVLIKQFDSFHDNFIETEKEVDPALAYNPFVLSGNEWKTIRGQLTPQFTASKIKAMCPLIQQASASMVEYIKNKTRVQNCNGIEIKDLSARFTGDNVMRCAYGLDGRSFVEQTPCSFKILYQNLDYIHIKQIINLFFPFLRRLFKFSFLGDPVPKLFYDIILDAIKYRDENNIISNDYLGFLLELKSQGITNDLLVAHAFTFFIDGFETSAFTMAYALFELASKPNIQNKVKNEIVTVLGKHNGMLTYANLQEMKYVDNVISETLRKHPIIQIISRICNNNCKLPSAATHEKKIIIEKGTHIFIPVLGVHNNPKYYQNPDHFNPDRFEIEAGVSRPKYSFLGFGDGPRICLGRKFALMQIKMGLVAIIANFELKVNANTQVPLKKQNLHVFNAPENDIWIDFHQRT